MVPQRSKKVPIDDLAVPLQQLCLRRVDNLSGSAAAGAADDRPVRLDLAEPMWQFRLRHTAGPLIRESSHPSLSGSLLSGDFDSNTCHYSKIREITKWFTARLKICETLSQPPEAHEEEAVQRRSTPKSPNPQRRQP